MGPDPRYGFKSAKRYYVDHDGKRYESKAIAGVAFGKQHPDRGPLKNTEFTGGVSLVGRKLKQLGFEFVDTLPEQSLSFGDLLADAMARFCLAKESKFGKQTDLWLAMDAVKARLLSYEAVLKRPHITCQWSLGAGNWLKTPWIALFDDRITTSAQRGVYVVLLISEDLEVAYLTLNQGATELAQQLKSSKAAGELQGRAIKYGQILQSHGLKGVSFEDDVDLRTNHPASRMYEYGSVAYVRKDPLHRASDEEMEGDLEALLTGYDILSVELGLIPLPGPAVPKDTPAMNGPTNLILYGPPGTGKTYQTALVAVQLCDGTEPAGGRAELMKRYKALKSAGRIEFVTFHQSFGYEDFIEGLRPQTGGDDDDQYGNSGGFRLKPEPGIFKRISTVAEQSGSAPSGTDAFDLSGRKFFKMSLGRSADQSEIYQAAIEGNYIALGYGGEYDWSDPKYEKWQSIFDRWKEVEPDIQPNRGDVVQTYSLRGAMKPGDIVIVADGTSKFRAIGEVTGPYQFVPGPDEFRHRRTVRWLKVFEKSLPVDFILDGKFSMMSIHSLNVKNIKIQALQNLIGGIGDTKSGLTITPEPYVLIIDEINRANVSKVFGELITLLEPDKRLGSDNALTVTLPYSKEEFGVPANLHVIGTMNTADRSIALLDTALRRRFRFQELMPQPELLAEASAATGIDLAAALTKLNSRIEYLFDREHQIGHAYFLPCKSKADVDDVMRGKVIPLLSEYFYESWEKVWQVLGEPEGIDDGAFLSRHKLTGPVGSGGETFGLDRWRYGVKAEFSATAYDQLK